MVRPQSAPRPVDLVHLRPDDRSGFLVLAMALAGTTVALWLSASGGWPRWVIGQAILALMLVQWFVILHECGHDTLFQTRRYHVIVGWIAGLFAGFPYRAWTRVHARHHKWTGWQDLDPTTAALVPRALRPIERAVVNTCWRCWIPLFSVLYRLTNFWHLPRLFRMFPTRAERLAVARDAAVLVVVYAGAVAGFGAATVLRTTGAAIVISLMIEDLLLLSQHTHVPQRVSEGEAVKPFAAVEQQPFTRSLRLPAPVSAFILHFDSHELHHMYPFVPGYHLRRIRYSPENEVSGWQWVRGAKRLSGEVLLFQTRLESGADL